MAANGFSEEELARGAPYGMTRDEWGHWQNNKDYIAKARDLGIDVSDSNQVRMLIGAMRYCSYKFAPGVRRTESELAGLLGVDENTVLHWKRSGLVRAASQIVLAKILSDEAGSDVRHAMMSTLQAELPAALRNVVRIATGRPADEGGRPPLDRDAVQAFSVLMDTKIVDAYLQLVLTGQITESSDIEAVEKAKSLLDGSEPLRLDSSIVEAESVRVVPKSSADTAEPELQPHS